MIPDGIKKGLREGKPGEFVLSAGTGLPAKMQKAAFLKKEIKSARRSLMAYLPAKPGRPAQNVTGIVPADLLLVEMRYFPSLFSPLYVCH